MKKITNSISKKINGARVRAARMIKDKRGDLAANTIGSIIVAVVIIGLLIIAVNAFFPGFFTSMFGKMAEKLNGNW
ncbi:MAG: hypothetical protein RSE64_06105 [Oscillospiraceae bacterium]